MTILNTLGLKATQCWCTNVENQPKGPIFYIYAICRRPKGPPVHSAPNTRAWGKISSLYRRQAWASYAHARLHIGSALALAVELGSPG